MHTYLTGPKNTLEGDNNERKNSSTIIEVFNTPLSVIEPSQGHQGKRS